MLNASPYKNLPKIGSFSKRFAPEVLTSNHL